MLVAPRRPGHRTYGQYRVYGMNIIVNTHTDFVHLAALPAWARRQGWW